MAVTINASTSAGLVNTADTSGVLQLQTAGTTALTVDTSANVGIGTASPASKLDVTATLRAVSSTAVAPTSGKGVEVWYDSSGDFGRIATYDRTGAAYKNQYIDGAALYLNSQSSGNVGIGTSSPVSKLDVRGTAGITSFTGTSPMAITTQGATSTNDYSGIDFTENGNAPRARIASYFSGSGSYLQFGTSNNYTSGITNTAMTIDYSGNVGIGATSVISKLQVVADQASYVNDLAQLTITGTNTNQRLLIGYNTSTDKAFIQATKVGTAYQDLVLQSGGGNLLVGTTNTSATAGVGMKFIFSADASNPVVKTVVQDSSGAYSTWNLYSTNASAYRFYVTTAGVVNATTTTITAISDQRLKENIRDLDDGLEKVLALKPRKFDWKENKGENIKNARGFIAQELELVFPDMVSNWIDEPPEGEEPYKAVNANLIPSLVKAIQEQQALITQLQADVAALKENK